MRMKELSITRTVRCPKEQIVEKEIYGDTIKHRKKNWPLYIDSCKTCQYHGGIKQNEKSPKVLCRYDEAPLEAKIKVLEEALSIIKEHDGSTDQLEDALQRLYNSRGLKL